MSTFATMKHLIIRNLGSQKASALGADAAPLLALQNEHVILMAERDDTFMEKLKHIRRVAATF